MEFYKDRPRPSEEIEEFSSLSSLEREIIDFAYIIPMSDNKSKKSVYLEIQEIMAGKKTKDFVPVDEPPMPSFVKSEHWAGKPWADKSWKVQGKKKNVSRSQKPRKRY